MSGSVCLLRSHRSSSTCIALFKTEAVLTFEGAVELRLLLGKLEIFGHVTGPSLTFQTLYSPSGYSHIVLSTVVESPLDFESLNTTELSRVDIEQIRLILGSPSWSSHSLGAVALLRETNTFLLHALKYHFSTEGCFLMDETPYPLRNFKTLPNFNHSLCVPQSYRDLCDKICTSDEVPVLLICGVGESGKSTFARLLTNSLLNHYESVSFLECDVGQCEFTVSGLVSLHCIKEPVHGPSFVHQRPPEKSFVFGDTSPKNEPSFYISLISRCMEAYKSHVTSHVTRKCPLIINTCGWTSGIGIHLLMDIIHITAPIFITQFIDNSTNLPLQLSQLTHDYINSTPRWTTFDQGQPPTTSPEELQPDIMIPSSSNLDCLRDLKGKEEREVLSTEEDELSDKEEDEEEEEEGKRLPTVSVTNIAIGHKPSRERGGVTGSESFMKGRSHERVWSASDCSVYTVTSFYGPRKKSVKERHTKLISYFSPLLEDLPSSLKTETVSNFILSVPPYQVSWDRLAVHCMHRKVPPSQLLYAMNGKFVWLARVKNEELCSYGSEGDGVFKLMKSSLPVAGYLGLGLVRGIDPRKRLLYITTPEALTTTLNDINCVIIGNTEKPFHVINQGHMQSPTPYLLKHFKHVKYGELGYES